MHPGIFRARHHNRTLLALSGWLIAAGAGCGFFHNPSDDPAPGATNRRAAGYPKFAVGVHYAERGLARPFGEAGIRWAKARMDPFAWGRIEKKAPERPGVHSYDWACADALVAEYQAAGVNNLQIPISSYSSWGTFSLVDLSPREEHREHYRQWVRALIERYDGDGTNDMPGLAGPVRYWIVGNEWTNVLGFLSSEDYLRVLELTHEAARSAWADVQIGAVPFVLFDVFEGDEPTEAQILARIADPAPPWRNSTLGLRRILDRPEIFDYVNVHSLGDYTELPPTVRWVRTEMRKRGYEKPIWIDEATPIGYLVARKANPDVDLPVIFPVTAPLQQRLHDLMYDVARMVEPAYGRSLAWMQTQTATGLVKKIVTAMAAGAVGIHMASTEDVMNDNTPFIRQSQVDLWGSAAMSGLIDVSRESTEVCMPRRPANPRPAFANLGLLMQKLGPAADGTLTQIPTEPRSARVYRYDRAGRPLWIVWNEPRTLHLPGEIEMPATVTIPINVGARARLTRVATAPPSEAVREVPLVEGALTLQLTSVPLFIEPL